MSMATPEPEHAKPRDRHPCDGRSGIRNGFPVMDKIHMKTAAVTSGVRRAPIPHVCGGLCVQRPRCRIKEGARTTASCPMNIAMSTGQQSH